MTQLFVSYSRKHETFARRLAASLSDLGADVWIDIEDIPAGMKWSRAIQQGLDVCDAMLVVITPESMASSNVEDEWQYYLDHQKPVIPLLLEPARVHFQLGRIQYVDFYRQPFDVALRQLHAEITRKGLKLKPMSRGEGSQGIPDQPPLPIQEESVPHPSGGLSISSASTPLARLQQRLSSRDSRVPILVVLILVIIVGAAIILTNQAQNQAAFEQTGTAIAHQNATIDALIQLTATQAVQIATLSADTPTPTQPPTVTPSRTPTRTPTLSGTQYEQTVQAEIALIQTEGIQTANADEIATRVALTATAASWTNTPTPNARLTAEARLTEAQAATLARATQDAIATMTQAARNLTATAASWTDTPTPTLTLTDTPTPSITPTRAPVIAGQALTLQNLRAGPGAGYEMLPDVLRPGNGFILLGRTPDSRWLYIRIASTGATGWIDASKTTLLGDPSIVAIASPPPTATTASNFILTGVLSTAEVRLRSSPTGEPLTELDEGTRLIIVGRTRDEGWLQVRVSATGEQGWIAASFVTVTGSVGDLPVTTSIDPLVEGLEAVIIGTRPVNLRTGPGVGFNVVEILPATSPVTVIGRNRDATWLQVRYESLTGWITADALSVEGNISQLPVTVGS